MNSSRPCAFRLTSFALAVALLMPVMVVQAADSQAIDDDLTDLSLEDLMKVVVVSASKFPQNSHQAPSAVQVLTAEDIRLHGWSTLAEALDSLPGMYASSDRAFGFLGARGFMVPGDYNMRFLLLLDGLPLNDNLYGQANLGHEFRVDMSLIDRIEYVPGPGSSIYGSNAMFGVVNVLTRSAASMPKLDIASKIQSDGWRELDIKGSYRVGGDGPDLVYTLSRASKLGQDLRYPDAIGLVTADGSASKDGLAQNLDRMIVTRAFAGLKQGGLALSAWAARREVQPSSALYRSNFNDSRLHLTDSSYGLTMAYQRAINDTLDTNFRFAYQKITYQGDSPYFDQSAGSYISRDEAVGSWLSGEARLLYTGLTHHKVIAGLDFQSDIEALQKNAVIGNFTDTPFSMNNKRSRYGVFLQDEWNFSTDWRLNAGLRSDSYSQKKSDISPRFALIWNATEQATLKLLAGQAYRAPNAYEENYARAPNYLANPDLLSETIRTLELVGQYRLDTAQELGASLYNYRLTQLISQVTTGSGQLQYQNQAAVRVSGVEVFHNMRSKTGLNMMSSVAVSRSRDETGRELNNSPTWVAKLRFRQPVWGERLTAALELNAVGPRQIAWRGNYSRLGMQAQANLALTTMHLAPGLELQMRIVNLFDRKNIVPASDETDVARLPTDGRQWQMGLHYAF